MICPVCGTEFEGNFCSNCGYNGKTRQPPINTRPVQTEFQRKAQKICLVICAICLVALIPCIIFMVLDDSHTSANSNSPGFAATPVPTSSSSPSIEVISISPSQLMDAYRENEINANELYLDKVLEITGTIDSIGIDILNQSYVTVGNGSGSFIDTVHCNLADDQIIAPSTLVQGNVITIKGTYIKNTLGVMLDECVITATY